MSTADVFHDLTVDVALERFDALTAAISEAMTIERLSPSEEKMLRACMFIHNAERHLYAAPEVFAVAVEAQKNISKESLASAVWQGFLSVIDAIRRALKKLYEWFRDLFSDDKREERKMDATSKTLADLKAIKANSVVDTMTAISIPPPPNVSGTPPANGSNLPPSDLSLVPKDTTLSLAPLENGATNTPTVVDNNNAAPPPVLNDNGERVDINTIMEQPAISEEEQKLIKRLAEEEKIMMRFPAILRFPELEDKDKISLTDVVGAYVHEVDNLAAMNDAMEILHISVKTIMDLVHGKHNVDMDVDAVLEHLKSQMDETSKALEDTYHAHFKDGLIYSFARNRWIADGPRIKMELVDVKDKRFTMEIDESSKDVSRQFDRLVGAVEKRDGLAKKFSALSVQVDEFLSSIGRINRNSAFTQVTDASTFMKEAVVNIFRTTQTIMRLYGFSASRARELRVWIETLANYYKTIA